MVRPIKRNKKFLTCDVCRSAKYPGEDLFHKPFADETGVEEMERCFALYLLIFYYITKGTVWGVSVNKMCDGTVVSGCVVVKFEKKSASRVGKDRTSPHTVKFF
jgi:hypothetical protein